MVHLLAGSGEVKRMNRLDKLFNKNWFIKLSSIVIAIMLFLMVNMDNAANQPGGLPGVTDGSRVLEEVDLQVYYDEDNYVLTEAPEFVQVNLRGPQNVLTVAQVTQAQQELFIDLSDMEAGIHYERVQHQGFPAGLTISVVPTTVRVTLQEKQTVSLPVEVDLLNEGEIEEGHVVGTPSVDPSSVDVTAAEGMIEQIAQARVAVDLTERATSFSESVPVSFYDQNGNELDLTGNPPAVEVDVPITSPNKDVPIRIGRNGELPDGVAIDSITTEPETVTIFGPVDVINDISFIDITTIDLTEITNDESVEVEVPIPEGVERVDPETITVEVEATEEEDREFNDFEIDVDGLDNEQSIEFISPEQGQFDLVVQGSPDALQRLERQDLQASIDVEGLTEGEYEEEVSISGPQNIRLQQNDITVSFILSENNGINSTNEVDENNGESNDEEEDSQDTS
jgi:YbbR domain-containing protein